MKDTFSVGRELKIPVVIALVFTNHSSKGLFLPVPHVLQVKKTMTME